MSKLVIEMQRVDRSHEAAIAGARDSDRFFTHSARKIARRRKCEESLYLCAVSCEQSCAQTIQKSEHGYRGSRSKVTSLMYTLQLIHRERKRFLPQAS